MGTVDNRTGRNVITAIINTAYDAVQQSKVGPIYVEDAETGKQVFNTLAYNVFLTVVARVIPTTIDANMSGDFTERKVARISGYWRFILHHGTSTVNTSEGGSESNVFVCECPGTNEAGGGAHLDGCPVATIIKNVRENA